MTDKEPIWYWFKSELFEIEEGEDEETNPQLYGRNLAAWIREKLIDLGYDVEEVIPEDFGWLVLCQQSPYSLGVSCVSYVDDEQSHEDDRLPTAGEVTWCCMLFVEVPVFKRLFGKPDTTQATQKLDRELRAMLESEPGIKLVDPL